jgi:hypothetical protein
MYLVCWNHDCRQTYPASDYKVTDRGVDCERCGHTLISPSGKVQISGVPYVIKTIDPAKLKEETCKHQKVYANYILTSNPPQHPWVCSICGETGRDQGATVKDNYTETIKRFNKEEDDV